MKALLSTSRILAISNILFWSICPYPSSSPDLGPNLL